MFEFSPQTQRRFALFKANRRGWWSLWIFIGLMLVCLCGGVLGVMLSLLAGAIASRVSNVAFLYSPTSMVAAFLCSSLIGVIFGFFPARRAAQLQPIHALERE
ncbi:hypothetical protein CVE36_01450 [Pseudomonas syringae pv. actinidiae]|nr:hypothetical protein [Pseudomonas syringae pv. actinidiae]